MVVGVCTFSPKDVPWNIPKPITIPQRDEVMILNTIINTPLNNTVLTASLKGDPQFMIKLMSQMAYAIEKNEFYTALRVISIGLYLDKHKYYKKKLLCAQRTWNGLDKKL